MKIISKFHDYYDSAAAFYDDTIIMLRKTDEVSSDISLPYRTKKIGISYGKSSLGEANRVAAVDYLYFCGKVYPLFSLFDERTFFKEENKKRVRVETRENKVYYNSLAELCAACEESKVSLKKGFFGRDYLKELEDELPKLKSVEINAQIFRNIGSPYFLVEGASVIIYPELKNMTKSFHMDAYIVYQELEMYIAGVLGQSEKEIVEISDIDKRNSKGFDDYSFKKRKQ